MDTTLLEEIGLTAAQAKAYKALIELGAATAPQIAEIIDESRTNTYKVLDKLCEIELAQKDQHAAKTSYAPTNPAALSRLVERQVASLDTRQRKLTAAMPSLLDYYFTHAEQPGIKFYQGKERIKQVFTEMLKTGETLYLLRTPNDVRFYNPGFFAEIRQKRRALGIKTVGITPDTESANHDPELDKKDLFDRTWISPDAYTANVEWNVAGDKVALLSYGKEAIGMIIESPQIAESFRQVFGLMQHAGVQIVGPEKSS